MQTQRITLRHIRGACVSAAIFINGKAMRSLSMANVVAHRCATQSESDPLSSACAWKVKWRFTRSTRVRLVAKDTPVQPRRFPNDGYPCTRGKLESATRQLPRSSRVGLLSHAQSGAPTACTTGQVQNHLRAEDLAHVRAECRASGTPSPWEHRSYPACP